MDLRTVLHELQNRLVSSRAYNADPLRTFPSTSPIVDFIGWVERNAEVMVVLSEIGLDFDGDGELPKQKPKARAGRPGQQLLMTEQQLLAQFGVIAQQPIAAPAVATITLQAAQAEEELEELIAAPEARVRYLLDHDNDDGVLCTQERATAEGLCPVCGYKDEE